MPPARKTATETADAIELGKIRRMTIRNFRAIGPTPVTVEIDTIVVLVGPNNAGKSSILRAYEVAMSDGSRAGHLTLEDFPNAVVDPANPPTIELETEVVGDPPAKKWIVELDGRKVVRERWIWEKPGPGKRQGWNTELANGGDWDGENVPWGAANVANSRRPQPHTVKAFDSPEEQAKQINTIILSMVQERALTVLADDGSGESEFAQLSKRLRDFQEKVVANARADIQEIEARLTEMVAGIFANHVVEFDPTPAPTEGLKLFAGNRMLVGHKDGYKSPIEYQGSGARRTLLWSVLRIISETAEKAQTRPHLLLIDEPELCLHPGAVREACRVLYDLADKAGWQVMVTTHHPAFIDLARDNKTIVRVERDNTGIIRGTTLFKPSLARLSADDKENLHLLNIFDPYVGELFFGGAIIVVEGDTEYAALRYVADDLLSTVEPSPIPSDLLRSMHVVRARGKATVASLAKILNHFGSRYSVLHDSDSPTVIVKDRVTGAYKEQKNPAWGANETILAEIDAAPDPRRIRLVASVPNFEAAYLDYDAKRDKPYTAVKRLSEDEDGRRRIAQLLHALLDHSQALPQGAVPTRDVLANYAATGSGVS